MQTLTTSIPTALRTALKEWAVTIRALREGRQVLLLRKGGIYDEGGEFEVAAREVLLFPTYLHEDEQRDALQPCYGAWREEETRLRASGEAVRISSWARITDIHPVTNPTALFKLSSQFIYSDSFLTYRLTDILPPTPCGHLPPTPDPSPRLRGEGSRDEGREELIPVPLSPSPLPPQAGGGVGSGGQVPTGSGGQGNTKPLYALFLRAYELPKPVVVPMELDYYGCKSWITLNEPIDLAGATPAMSDRAYAERVRVTLRVLREG